MSAYSVAMSATAVVFFVVSLVGDASAHPLMRGMSSAAELKGDPLIETIQRRGFGGGMTFRPAPPVYRAPVYRAPPVVRPPIYRPPAAVPRTQAPIVRRSPPAAAQPRLVPRSGPIARSPLPTASVRMARPAPIQMGQETLRPAMRPHTLRAIGRPIVTRRVVVRRWRDPGPNFRQVGWMNGRPIYVYKGATAARFPKSVLPGVSRLSPHVARAGRESDPSDLSRAFERARGGPRSTVSALAAFQVAKEGGGGASGGGTPPPTTPPGSPPSLKKVFNHAAKPGLRNVFADAVTGRLSAVTRPRGTPTTARADTSAASGNPGGSSGAGTSSPQRTPSYAGPAIQGPRINDAFNRAARGDPPPKPPRNGSGEDYGDFDSPADGPKPPNFPRPR